MSLVSSTFIGVIILTTILYYISPKKIQTICTINNKYISIFKFRNKKSNIHCNKHNNNIYSSTIISKKQI